MFVRKATFDAVVAELAVARLIMGQQEESIGLLSGKLIERGRELEKLRRAREKSNANLKSYRKEVK